METIINRAGVETIYWTMNDGTSIEAIKEEVDILGKELFEEDFNLLKKQGFPYEDCDGISYLPNDLIEASLKCIIRNDEPEELYRRMF